MRFERGDDPDAFMKRVWPFVAERLERNVIGTLLLDVQAGRHDEYLLAYGLDDDDRVAWVGMRIAPWYLLTSDLNPPLAGALLEFWLRFDPNLNGVDGPPDPARAVADAWASRTGGTTSLRISEAMHALSEVFDPPHGIAAGGLRIASESRDRELLIEWMVDFQEEAGMPGQGRDQAARSVEVWLSRGGLLIWDDRRPVSFVGVQTAVAGVARIGPVYTPPEHRRRGYAGCAVAAASRRALAAGAERCMLFTDLSNPTSNKIYAEVGYRRCGAWEQYAFDPAPSPPATP
jgi:RimJ/RimL family protein N-acetyltransferase